MLKLSKLVQIYCVLQDFITALPESVSYMVTLVTQTAHAPFSATPCESVLV